MTDIARLNIQVDSSSARRASTDLNRMRNTGRQTESRMASMTKTAVRLGTALAGAFVVRAGVRELVKIIGIYSDYQAQLAKVQAVSRATSDEMERMEKTIRNLGATTRFSASQAAQGTQYLAMAGFEVNEIISALPGVLQLATAGSLDLGRAADIASNALTAMRLDVEELGRVNDVFVRTITTSNTDMEQLAQAFKYAGSVGAAFGYEVEDIAGYLAKMADAGIQGSMGGTQLAMALQKASSVFRHYGVQAGEGTRYTNDLAGAMLLLEERGATAEQVMELFGERAGRGVAAMLGQGARSIQEYIDELYNAEGAAKEVSDMMGDTLAGDFLALRSAIESVQLSIGENLMPSTREYIGVLTEWIRANEELIGQKVDGAIMGVVAALEKAYAVYNMLPGFMVGPAGIGIVGAVLFGGKVGLIIATIILVERQLDKLGMGVKDLAADMEKLKDIGTDSWDILKGIHDGERHFWSGELKTEIEIAKSTLDSLKEERAGQEELAGFGSGFAIKRLETLDKRIEEQKKKIQDLIKEEQKLQSLPSTAPGTPSSKALEPDTVTIKPKFDKESRKGLELFTPQMLKEEEDKLVESARNLTDNFADTITKQNADAERAYHEMYRYLGEEAEGYYKYKENRIQEEYEKLKSTSKDEVLAHQWKTKQLEDLYKDMKLGPVIDMMEPTDSFEHSINEHRKKTENAYQSMYGSLKEKGEGYYKWNEERIEEQYQKFLSQTNDQVLAEQWKSQQLKNLYSTMQIETPGLDLIGGTTDFEQALDIHRNNVTQAYETLYRDLGSDADGYFSYMEKRIEEQYEYILNSTQNEVLAHEWKVAQLRELYEDFQNDLPGLQAMDHTSDFEKVLAERRASMNQAYDTMYSDLRTKTTGYYDWEEQKIYEQYEYLKQVTGDEVLAYQWKYEQILALNDQFNTDMDSRNIEAVGEMERAFTGWASTMSSQLNDIVWQADTSFKDIARSFAKMLTQMAIQKAIVAPMLGGAGGLLDSAFGLAHTGGIIGKDVLPKRKLSDGLKSDEYPVILQKGEAVFTEEQLRALSDALPQDAVQKDDELKRAFASAQRMHSGLAPSNMGSNDKSSMTNIEVNVINKTGTSADASVTKPKFDGERWVMSVVLDAAHRNRGGFAKGLKTALGKS